MSKKLLCRPTCFVCGSQLQYSIRRNDGYKYFHCSNCDLVLSSPAPKNKEIRDFYLRFLFRKPAEEKYFSKQVKEICLDVKKIIRDIRGYKKLSERPTLLDCGGGTGFYSYAFYRNGFEVTLIDIDKSACDYAKKWFPNCFEVVEGDFSIPVPSIKKYDIIFVNQFIEHLVDINTFLANIKKAVKKGGIVIFTTPNQKCKEFYFRPFWLYYYLRKTSNNPIPLKSFIIFLKKPWICCDPPRHIYSFNEKNFTILLKKNGFDIIAIKTEYSTEQYYSGRFYNNYRIETPRDFGRIVLNILVHLGVKLLKLIDGQNKWGNNLIVFAKLTNQ